LLTGGNGAAGILSPSMQDRPALELVRETFPELPALDTAVSRAILLRVSAGELAETLRLGRPGAMVAFGRQDVASPGYPAAVRAARVGGFEAVERLAGGRAAVFHEQTVALAHAIPDSDPLTHTHERFEQAATIVADALISLGVDARIGEVPGEYCPGMHSVNARGRVKLAGIGQRVIRGAAHLGGVVVVGESERLRGVLVPVYAALGLDWAPETAGSVEDELGGVRYEAVEQAIIAQLQARYELTEVPLGRITLALAERLASDHLSPPFAGAGTPGTPPRL
jgi:octanoyl-[GcvH]:protein N-octanoyltransferase